MIPLGKSLWRGVINFQRFSFALNAKMRYHKFFIEKLLRCNKLIWQKEARIQSLHHSLKLSKLRVKYLEGKVERLMRNQALELHDSDCSDIVSIISDVQHKVEENFAPDSPQRILWDQQMKYNRLQDKRQMRWHPLVIRYTV